MGGQRPWTSRGPEVMGLTRSTVPSGLRSSMLPRTGKGFPAAAQLIRGVVSKLNSSSETMSKIWGIRSGERGDTHPGGPVRADTRLPQSHHPESFILVEAPPASQSHRPASQQSPGNTSRPSHPPLPAPESASCALRLLRPLASLTTRTLVQASIISGPRDRSSGLSCSRSSPAAGVLSQTHA